MTSMRTHGALQTPARWTAAAWVVLGLAVAASCWGALAVAQGPGRLTTYAGHSGLAAAPDDRHRSRPRAGGPGHGARGFGADRRPDACSRDSSGSHLSGSAGNRAPWCPEHRDGRGGLHPPASHPRGARFPRAAECRPSSAAAVVAGAYLGGRCSQLSAEGSSTTPSSTRTAGPTARATCSLSGHSRTLPSRSKSTERWLMVGAAATLAALCGWRLVTGSAPARRVLVPVVLPAVLFAASVAVHVVADASIPLEDPSEPVFLSTYVVRLHHADPARRRACVGLLAHAPAAPGRVPDRVESRCCTCSRIVGVGAGASCGRSASSGSPTGSPTQRVTWTHPVGPSPNPRPRPAVWSRLSSSGERRVALVSHAQGVPEIETAMGAAVRMALDNERCRQRALPSSRSCELPAPESSRRAIWRDGGSSGISMTEPSSDSWPPPTRSDSPVRAPTQADDATHWCTSWRARSKGRRPLSTSSGSLLMGSTRRSSGKPGLPRRSRPWPTRLRCGWRHGT